MSNMSSIDRLARILAGAILILLPLVTSVGLFSIPALHWGAIIVGAVLVGTGFVSFCPLYALLGLSTKTK